jgi:hypothetical protein
MEYCDQGTLAEAIKRPAGRFHTPMEDGSIGVNLPAVVDVGGGCFCRRIVCGCFCMYDRCCRAGGVPQVVFCWGPFARGFFAAT